MNSPVLEVDLLRSNPSCFGLVFASCLGCWLCAENGVWGVLRGVCDWWGCTGGSCVAFCGWDCWDWWDWGLLGNEDTLLGLEGGEALCVNAKAWLCNPRRRKKKNSTSSFISLVFLILRYINKNHRRKVKSYVTTLNIIKIINNISLHPRIRTYNFKFSRKRPLPSVRQLNFLSTANKWLRETNRTNIGNKWFLSIYENVAI